MIEAAKAVEPMKLGGPNGESWLPSEGADDLSWKALCDLAEGGINVDKRLVGLKPAIDALSKD
eukprot:3938225-Pyramimonas_sp.AAC.1